MTATRNDGCHNHLCLPLLSMEGASPSSPKFPSQKEKSNIIVLVEEILGKMEALAPRRSM